MDFKYEFDEEELDMRAKGYRYKLWLETETDDGMRWRTTEYFKTREEVSQYVKEYFKRHTDEYFSDEEVIDLLSGELA